MNSAASARWLVLVALLVGASAITHADRDQAFLREMVAYSEAWQDRILAEGRPLTDDEQLLAREAGVAHPGRVRVLVLPSVPLPESELLIAKLDDLDMLELMDRARGMTKGYGIIVAERSRNSRWVLTHELVHVGQYERLGGIEPAMRQHLPDLEANGYRSSALEDEAYRRTEEILNGD